MIKGHLLTSKHQILVGLSGGLWLILFLVVVAPFDVADQPFSWRAKMMIGYGVVFFLSYLSSIPFQNWIYRIKSLKRLPRELLGYLFVFGICLPLSFAYYRSGWINGDFSFSQFSIQIYLATIAIFWPFLIFARWTVPRLFPKPTTPISRNKIVSNELEILKTKIHALMEEGIYLDSQMSLRKMATLAETNESILSKAINQGFDENFNDFLNRYRIHEVIGRFQKKQYQTHTLTGIATECGFNSKATFNRAFKKQMGITPTAYIEQLKIRKDGSNHDSVRLES